MLFHCKVCGKEGKTKPSENQKYCSKVCFRSTQTPKIKYICKNCGKEGICKKSANRKFCSLECANIERSRRLTRKATCLYCKIFFECPKSNTKKFCSNACVNLSQSKKITFQCRECGKEAKCKPSMNRKFCSNTCVLKNGERKRTYSCTQCSITFQISKEGKPKPGKPFCSSACFNIYQTGENNVSWKGVKESRKCETCNNDFWVKTTQRKTIARFCSVKCKCEFYNSTKWPRTQEELIRIYPIGWNNVLREIIRNRDKYECKICGIKENDLTRNLHVHHINFIKDDLSFKNLISLCGKCHNGKAHSKDKLIWKEKLSRLSEELEIYQGTFTI